MKLYDYIQYRIHANWYETDVYKLIAILANNENIVNKSGIEIVQYVRSISTPKGKKTLSKLIDSYRSYCRLHNEEAEVLTLKKQRIK